MTIKNPLAPHTPATHRQGKTEIIPTLPMLFQSGNLYRVRDQVQMQVTRLTSLKTKVEKKALDPINFLEVDQVALDHYLELLESLNRIIQAENDFREVVLKNFYVVDPLQENRPKVNLNDLVKIQPD